MVHDKDKECLTDYLLWERNNDTRRCYKLFIKFLIKRGVYERYVAAFFHPRNRMWLEKHRGAITPFSYISSAFDWGEESENYYQYYDENHARYWGELSEEWQHYIIKNNLYKY